MPQPWQKFLSNEQLASLSGLSIHSKRRPGGTREGTHASRQIGHAMEFAQHREYTPGDDLRYVDWKIFGRSDRYYVRQSEIERALPTYLMLDHSCSMTFAAEDAKHSKLDFAIQLALSITYLATTQQDAIALYLVSNGLTGVNPLGSGARQLDRFAVACTDIDTSAETNIYHSISESVGRIEAPGLVVLISDLLDDEEQIGQALNLLRDAGHDVILLHVMDRQEREFQFTSETRFIDLEELGQVDVNAAGLSRSYREQIEAFISRQQNAAFRLGFRYSTAITDLPLREALLPDFCP